MARMTAKSNSSQKQKAIEDVRSYLVIIASSFLLSLAAEAIARSGASAHFSALTPHGVIRAWIFCAFAYCSITPLAIYLTRSSLSSFRPKPGPLWTRMIYLMLGLAIFLPVFLSPVLFLSLASESVGRSHLVYTSLTGSSFGLAVTGGTLFYSVAVAIWLVSGAVKHVFNR
ncbi:hypothetical protein [Pseudoxanthomonas composti]|uniref:Uncharacterized protein n=1 Tax=Pseudoxanthomonas composti TaxID=2137479 RepID=A0A4Q1JT52_9GAMM|nr:hypothetical protein [Pseudoxanthomonas composti]RXR03468.1 hypothetical protein EPA99_13615 [Pseudoxanthomonas composti]